MRETELIVVGAGLAGTLLAREWINRGRDCVVIDDGLRDAASVVATGLITPVTGVRLATAPDAAGSIDEALRVFGAIATPAGTPSIRALSLFRGYVDEEEKRLKATRAAAPGNARWFGADVTPAYVHPSLAAPLGGFMIEGGARVDLPALLRAEHARLGDRRRDEPFVHADLEILPDGTGVRYRDLAARRIVFAEGAAVTRNPWFAGPVWKPAKGEFITCDCGDFPMPGFALKLGLSAVPLGEGHWRIGSNYDRQHLDTHPTPAIRAMLEDGFRRMFRRAPDFVVTDHGAGVRPAAEGAKPVVRAHGAFPALHVFNGFGAKGCTWAPRYARLLADRLAD